MPKLQTAAFTASLVFAALTSQSTASAQHTVNIPASGGWLVVGKITPPGGSTRQWAGFEPSGGGRCSWWLLGESAGLSDDVVVNGSSGADRVLVLENNMTFCGQNMAPVTFNGHDVGIQGWGGNDIIGGRAAWMSGGSGHDYLAGSDGTTTTLWGWTGNDKMWGGSGASMYGESGLDALCSIGTSTASLFNGGSDWGGDDVGCGSANSWVGIESSNPSFCPLPCL